MSDVLSKPLDAALAEGNWSKLLQVCRRVLRKNPSHHKAHRLLGFSLRRLGRTEEALNAYRKASILFPTDAEVLVNHAQALLETARWPEAVPILKRATALRPGHLLILAMSSQAYYMSQMNVEGFACAESMLALASTDGIRSAALNAMALHERELGRVSDAVSHCTEAVRLCPTDLASHTNRLLFMLADPGVKASDIKAAALDFGNVAETLHASKRMSHNPDKRQPTDRLRLGFISPDFRNHSVMYFMEGVLAQLDRRQFVVVGLHLHGNEDAVTDRVKAYVDEFVVLAHKSFDEQLAAIQAVRPDILVDLAGHTGNNGLALMACKPAPIQATWIGYPGTTGMAETMDYLITDPATDPSGVENLYSERLLRLDSRLCVYRPLVRNPLYRYQPAYAVKPTPALEAGYITFGSCNNLGKLTDNVLSTWARIVSAVPHAQLLIEGKGFENDATRQRYKDRCVGLGFRAEQLKFVPLDGRNQYLTYHDIDIALDPFPLNGGTTSMDVLWMGVPLVAMAGHSFRDRLSAGILLHLGRSEWLASDVDGYVQIACNLAKDFDRLNHTRLNLRNELEQSILMREDRFCHRFGLSLRRIWVQWLAEQRYPQDLVQQSAYTDAAMRSLPDEWLTQPSPGVGLKPGVRVSLVEAQGLMQTALERAHDADKKTNQGALKRAHPYWHELTALCDTVLASIPNEPFALACLAEVEHAAGHTDFAVTYLRYAQTAINLNTQG